MLNTPLAAPSPTSAPKAAAMSAAPNRTKHDAAEKTTPADTEESKGFSDFFQETGTSKESIEQQKTELSAGETNKSTAATPDDTARADPDFEAIVKPIKTVIPVTGSLVAQNVNRDVNAVSLPVAQSTISSTDQGPANAIGATVPIVQAPNTNANIVAINATADHQQVAQPATPTRASPPQIMPALNPSHNASMQDGNLGAQPAIMLSSTDSAAQTINPLLAEGATKARLPTAHNVQTPATESKRQTASYAMPHARAASLAQAPPPPAANAYVQASNSVPDPIAGPNSSTEPLGQAINPSAPNSQVIASNLGQQHTANIRDRNSRDSLPPTSDSTAVAVRAKTATSANSNTGATQSAATANTYALLDNAQPSEAAIEWQADAELAFDPKTDPRAAVTGTGIGTSRSDPVFHRPEIPRQVANQLADIAQRMTGKSVELSLNPEELGRIRLSLTPADAGMVVTVVAERGETLDLMRRNIEILAQEFRDIGYDDVSFSFGQQNGENADNSSGDSDGSQPSTTENQDTTTTEQQKLYQITLSPTDGIDIRV